MRPHSRVYNFFAFVNKCSPHRHELLPLYTCVPVYHVARFVAQTGYLEHLCFVSRLAVAAQAVWVQADWAAVEYRLLIQRIVGCFIFVGTLLLKAAAVGGSYTLYVETFAGAIIYLLA